MTGPPSGEGGERREHTVRVVKSGILGGLSEDPIERYQHHFVHLVERHLDRYEQPVTALDLDAGIGQSTLTLLARFPAGSRVVALSSDRADLRLFHEQLDREQRQRVFPRKERRDRVPFAAHVFDVVWGALAREQLKPLRGVLRQALRVLRPGGQLVLSVPLRATFAEMAKAISPNLLPHQQDPGFAILMTAPTELADPDGWRETLLRCGAIEPEVKTETVEIGLAPPLSSQALFCRFLLPLWVGEGPEAQGKALRLLDVCLTTPLQVTVHLACVCARRGLMEIKDETQSS
jgi:SAM-dependent methyltransferase